MDLTRRAVIGAAAGAGAALALGGCGADLPTLPRPDTPGLRIESGTVTTPLAAGGKAGWQLTIPEHPVAVAVALHGRGGDAHNWADLLDAAAHARRTRLAIAAIDGGETYWHPRRDGTNTEKLVLDTLFGIAAEHGIATTRVGFTGLSMGGYGALYLATRLPRRRVVGVAVMSPALWRQAGDSAPGAFDDADDYRAHDVWTDPRRAALRALPVWLAVGDADPFAAATHAYADVIRPAGTSFGPGGHDVEYWNAHWGAGLDVLAAHV